MAQVEDEEALWLTHCISSEDEPDKQDAKEDASADQPKDDVATRSEDNATEPNDRR